VIRPAPDQPRSRSGRIAAWAGHSQPDLRGGQPGRDFVGSGKALQDAFRGLERGKPDSGTLNGFAYMPEISPG
jgi:hypothetical protein